MIACHPRAPVRADEPSRPELSAPRDTAARETAPREPQRSSGATGSAARDSFVQVLQARRAQWQARHITHYSIRVTVGCFCPWPRHPAILEVRDGIPVALRDTMGKSLGAPREPWSRYTVEGLFDFIERGARTFDVLEVTYDSRLDYPTSVRGDAKRGQVDDWFTVTADRLTSVR